MKHKTLFTLAFLTTSLSANAAFIYHNTATTTGGEFSGSFPIGNLNNGGHTSHLDTEDGNSTGSYATVNPATGGFPVTITLEFSAPTDLAQFYVWNHSNNGGAGAPSNGMGSFTLTFFDAASAGGSQIGSVFSDDASAAPATGLYAAEVFDFGTTYSNVRSATLVVTDKINGTTGGFMAIREIGFDTTPVPEPSSTALLGLGGLALIIRRRR